jgi:hypothetical protein
MLLALSLLLAACGGNPAPTPAQTSPGPAPTEVAPGDGGAAQGTPGAEEPGEPTATPRGGRIDGAASQAQVSDPKWAKPERRPLAVMVENHPDARPQTGLERADVVYEAPAEFGIPRFLALYVNEEVETLGPVRSARPYYVAWASEYDPVYIHAGGSPQALNWLEQLGMDSVDAIRDPVGGFERTTDRVAPHNLYMDTAEVRESLKGETRMTGGSWGGLRFGERPTVGTADGARVALTYPTGYRVAYAYDERSGRYLREMDGKPHLDRETKEQLGADVVIVQSVRFWEIEGDRYGRLEAGVQDEGSALIFQDGRMIQGRWSKDKRDTPTSYTDAEGRPVTLKEGAVWIQILPKRGSTIER